MLLKIPGNRELSADVFFVRIDSCQDSNFDYSAIQPIRMKYSDAIPTIAQRSTPCNRGRQPTSLRVEREMPVPMRNNVAVRPTRPIMKSECEKGEIAGK